MGNGEKVKVTKEYEASDIDDKNDKLHATLLMSLTLTMVTWPKVDLSHTDDDVLHAVKGQVALFLNMLNRSGYIISPKEEIPEVFKTI